MPDNCQDIIAALDRKIEDATNSLGAAKQAALDIPALTADLSRLEAARKALAAPQTPKGRRKIGDAQRGRKRGTQVPVTDGHAAAPQAAPVRRCDVCKTILFLGAGRKCPAEGCDAWLCSLQTCTVGHNDRWHMEEK